MAALNFCHPGFYTTVTSDKVSRDGFEASCLVTGSRGYLGESFIRTPVNITLTFACNVDIHMVLIEGAVGAQKATSFELFTLHDNRTIEKLQVQEAKPNDCQLYKPVAKAFTKDQTTFCFKNNMFRPRPPFSNLAPMPGRCYENAAVGEMRCYATKYLSSVCSLIVKIARTAQGCVPCLGWIEVWGQPALSTKASVINEVLELYHSIMKPAPRSDKTKSSDPNVPRSSEGSQKHDWDKFDNLAIPEEFLDPITQEVMTLPMLLPSGHNVDQTTLDRHQREEAQWGRNPSDPFTGVLFSRGSQPILNASLKVRIDHFLLKHGSELKLNRATLTPSHYQNPTTSSLTRNSKVPPSGLSHTVSDLGRQGKDDVPCTSNSATSGHQCSTFHLAGSTFDTRQEHSQPPTKKPRLESDTSRQDWRRDERRNHVANDLDTALDMALMGLPSFQTRTNTSSVLEKSKSSSKTTCVFCSKETEISGLYKLGCEHLACRACLVKVKGASNQLKCSNCDTVSCGKDIVKAHA